MPFEGPLPLRQPIIIGFDYGLDLMFVDQTGAPFDLGNAEEIHLAVYKWDGLYSPDADPILAKNDQQDGIQIVDQQGGIARAWIGHGDAGALRDAMDDKRRPLRVCIHGWLVDSGGLKMPPIRYEAYISTY